MVSFELDLLRYKRGALTTFGLLLGIALSFFVFEGVLTYVESTSTASLISQVGLRLMFYMMYAIIGLGCLVFAVPLAVLTYRLVYFKSKYRLELDNDGNVDFLSPLEFTRVKFNVNDAQEVDFLQLDGRYTVEFTMNQGSYLKRAVRGEVKHQIYVTEATFTALRKMVGSTESFESDLDTKTTKIEAVL